MTTTTGIELILRGNAISWKNKFGWYYHTLNLSYTNIAYCLTVILLLIPYRCPAWCDRILMNDMAVRLVQQVNLYGWSKEYNLIIACKQIHCFDAISGFI